MVQKLRHTLTPVQRLERAIRKVPWLDPVTPVLMHAAERHLGKAENKSDLEAMLLGSTQGKPKVQLDVLTRLVHTWKELPNDVKALVVPKALLNIPLHAPVDMRMLVSAFQEMEARSPTPDWSRGIPRRPRQTGTPVHIRSVSPVDPDGVPYIYLGQQFTISADNLSLDPGKNTATFRQVDNQGNQLGSSITVNAVSSTTGQAVFVSPPADTWPSPGRAKLSVESEGHAASAAIDVFFDRPVAPAVRLRPIQPSVVRPENRFLVEAAEGQAFAEHVFAYWKALDPVATDTVSLLASDQVERLNDSQILITCPATLTMSTGRYILAVWGDHQALSNWVELTLAPHEYRVDFTTIRCIDESDPEWWGDDEIIAKWALATADETGHSESQEYDGFEDGTVKPFTDADKTVFVKGGKAGPLRLGIVIGVLLYEADASDAKAWTEAIKFVSDNLKPLTEKIPWLKWVELALPVFSKLIAMLGGDADLLGSNTLTFSAQELLDLTRNPERSFSRTIDYRNDDDTGSFQLDYTVYRTTS